MSASASGMMDCYVGRSSSLGAGMVVGGFPSVCGEGLGPGERTNKNTGSVPSREGLVGQ